MYNLGMKNIVENKANIWINKYKYNTILTLIIFILFLILGYSNSNIKYKLYVNNAEANLGYGIYEVNNEQYIHIDDLTNIFKDNIYHDKISGKIIITTKDAVKKISKTDKDYTAIKDNNIYFNIASIISALSHDLVVSNDKIHVVNNEYTDAIVKKNRTEVYDKLTHDVIVFVQNGSKIKLVVDDCSRSEKNIVNVVATVENKNYYGYILKENVQYDNIKLEATQPADKIVLVKAGDILMSSTDTRYIDMVAIDMYRLSGANVLTQLEYTNNVPDGIQVLATINNGQASSNYDPDITTAMLNSESNREVIIQKILKGVENIDGVNIDFGNLKVSDKEEYTQFIKELAAIMHANNKKIIVNIPSIQYIEVANIAKTVDYVVIQPYVARTTSSKTSGPISSITYVENTIQDILSGDIEESKVILEIPAYSILWTERKGTVINAEKYNMQMMQEYITTNKIESKLDSVSKQNYINYTKGITTYKMWLEDEYSINQKAQLAAKYNLAGVSIFKSGMELGKIYSGISNSLNK